MVPNYVSARRARVAALLAGTFFSCTIGGAAFGQTVLPAIDVEGQTQQVQTEGTNSYTAPRTTVGKDALQLKEVPQSITVITRERIQDQNMTSLEDAARASPGVVIFQNDRGRSSIFSRGYEFTEFSIDGLPAPLSSIYGTQPDLAPFDRVEVLRGPASLFAGSGEPAGTLNLARKRALSKWGATGSATVGSWDSKRTEVDVTGPLNSSGTVRARAVGAYNKSNSFIDYVKNEGGVGYGTVEVDLNPQTTASFVILHQEKDMVPQNGLPAYANGQLANVPQSTFSGRSWNRFQNKVTDVLGEVEHRFDNGGHAKAGVRYSDRFVDFKYAYGGGAINPTTGNYNSIVLARQYWETSLSGDAHISTPFSLFGQTHNLTAGADYRTYKQTTYALAGNGTLANGTNNIFNPNPNTAEPAVNFASRNEVAPTQMGIYGQLRLKPVDRVTAILGGRVSWYQQDGTNLVTGATTSMNENNVLTPYLGLIVDLTSTISAYGIYTDVFQPQPTSFMADGTAVRPRTGQQYEMGLKGAFMGGALNASLAYFITRDSNRAVRDAAFPTFVIGAGEVEVSGVEAEISGQLAPGWQIQAGYAYTASQYLKTVTTAQGTFVEGQAFATTTPKHAFNVWSKYEFQNAALRGWHVAGGLRAMSEFYSLSAGVNFVENGYVVADAQIGYKWNEKWEATFSVNNLLDEVYYARVGAASTFNFYGEPRTFWLKLAAKT